MAWDIRMAVMNPAAGLQSGRMVLHIRFRDILGYIGGKVYMDRNKWFVLYSMKSLFKPIKTLPEVSKVGVGVFVFVFLWNVVLFNMAYVGQYGGNQQAISTWMALCSVGLFVSLTAFVSGLSQGKKVDYNTEEHQSLVRNTITASISNISQESAKIYLFNSTFYFIELCDLIWIDKAQNDVKIEDGQTTTLLFTFPTKQIDYFFLMVQIQFIGTFVSSIMILWMWLNKRKRV